MNEVFVSYNREDEPRVGPFVTILAGHIAAEAARE
jgi:hypothetical protein